MKALLNKIVVQQANEAQPLARISKPKQKPFKQNKEVGQPRSSLPSKKITSPTTKVKNFSGKDWLNAARQNFDRIIKDYLENEPDLDVNWKFSRDAMTALHLSCDAGHKEIVQTLLAQPLIEVNAKNQDGKSPVYLACEQGHTEVLQVLLDDGRANLDLADKDGITPFWIACCFGHTQAVKNMMLSDLKFSILEEGLWSQKKFNALGISKHRGHDELVNLLKRHRDGPQKAREWLLLEQKNDSLFVYLFLFFSFFFFLSFFSQA